MKFLTRLSMLISVVISFLLAAGSRSKNGDLFMGLCSGRDTLNGLLAYPDTWSYLTDGQVWIDQSWLSHLVYYLSYLGLGEWGPVLVKAVVLAVCMGVAYYRCRALGASVNIALFALVLGTLSLAPFYSIRGEGFGVMYLLILTIFLTAPAAWGRWRQIGCFLVLAVWANSHGSFVLGMALIAMRLGVELFVRIGFFNPPPATDGTRPHLRTDEPVTTPERHALSTARNPADVLGWTLTLIASAATIAVITPYGIDNLLMPFHQVQGSFLALHSKEWDLLLSFPFETRLLRWWDARPFYALLLLTGFLLVYVVIEARLRSAVNPFPTWVNEVQILVEFLIVMLMVVLVFRFRRVILFASLSMVPFCAFLMHTALNTAMDRMRISIVTQKRRILLKSIQLAGALLGLAFMCSIFYTVTVIPYLPGNPLYEEAPLRSKLMSFDGYRSDVADFMRRNGLNGRVFASWNIADVALFYHPKIQIFVDYRDQSAYTDEAMMTFFSTLYAPQRKDLQGAKKTLDQYRVAYVLLENKPADSALGFALMLSKEWACIYKDDQALLLARSTSSKLGPMITSGSLELLWYPSDIVRTISEGFLWLFMKDDIPAELLSRLKAAMKVRPDPIVYQLITRGINGSAHCLNPVIKAFLIAEETRLSNAFLHHTSSCGASKELDSRIKILTLLFENEAKCGSPASAKTFEVRRDQAYMERKRLSEEYRSN